MTDDQKEKIPILRHKGHSYSQIAVDLGISENTVKSFCRRNDLGTMLKNKPQVDKETYIICKQCGKSLTHGTKGQPKKFCSEECRRTWWKVNESYLAKKAYYMITCTNCGKYFESYGNKSRKFCSHACFINFRKGGESVVTRAV